MYPNSELKIHTRILVLITFIIMLIVNALSEILPINGMSTGQISDSYPNLFAPANFTFLIWILIYFLLVVYTLYQLGLFHDRNKKIHNEIFNEIGIIFSISSLANAFWILFWHYNLIKLSMIMMLVILSCLILINQIIMNENLEGRNKLFINLPFSIYFGWIIIATIANATTLLVSIGWNRFGLSESVWTVIILIIGMLVGVSTMINTKDFVFGLVFIWTYLGVLIKHISKNGFSGNYLSIIITVIICIVLFLLIELIIISSRNNRQKQRYIYELRK